MISLLRRKRQTTAVPSTPAPTAASLASVGLLLAVMAAPAQEASPPGRLLHFSKPPNPSLIPSHSSGNDRGAVPMSASAADTPVRPVAFQAAAKEPTVRTPE